MSRLLDAKKNNNESQEELSLRPQTLDEYVGQKDLKANLKVFIGAALHRDEPLDHILFYGPPGLGKTTLAYVVANEMHANIHFVNGPALEKPGDLGAILSNLNKDGGDILFIDEIHRLPRIVEETLYNAMEDFKFSVVINRDTSARTLTIDLPPFTLIGATTRAGNLSALEIAKRSRGTPRIANRLFRRVRDFANYAGQDHITINDALQALKALKVDELGLDDVDIKYLKTIIERFKGGPVGLDTLASAIGEEIDNLEDVYEPYLLQIGMIDRTARGRVATDKAYKHLQISYQTKLF